jgi:hypothetical protein
MKTYTCDRCGIEEHDKLGITGREFVYLGFKTLNAAFRWNDIVDVCAGCFKEIEKAEDEARKEADVSRRRGFLSRLGIGA